MHPKQYAKSNFLPMSLHFFQTCTPINPSWFFFRQDLPLAVKLTERVEKFIQELVRGCGKSHRKKWKNCWKSMEN